MATSAYFEGVDRLSGTVCSALPLTRVMDAIPESCDPKLWYSWNEPYGSVRGVTKNLADALLTSQARSDKDSLSSSHLELKTTTKVAQDLILS